MILILFQSLFFFFGGGIILSFFFLTLLCVYQKSNKYQIISNIQVINEFLVKFWLWNMCPLYSLLCFGKFVKFNPNVYETTNLAHCVVNFKNTCVVVRDNHTLESKISEKGQLVTGEAARACLFSQLKNILIQCVAYSTQWIWWDSSLEKYVPLTLFERVVCERELETEQNCNILTSPLLWPSAFLSRSPGLLNRGPSFLLGADFLYHILSPNSLISKLTDFLSSPSYIIVQSPTHYLPITGHRNVSLQPSLEWHVWSSLRGNNCHAVHRSLSSGASVCDCTVGFWPCLILSTKLAHTNGICTSAIFGMACLVGLEVNIQQVLW